MEAARCHWAALAAGRTRAASARAEEECNERNEARAKCQKRTSKDTYAFVNGVRLLHTMMTNLKLKDIPLVFSYLNRFEWISRFLHRLDFGSSAGGVHRVGTLRGRDQQTHFFSPSTSSPPSRQTTTTEPGKENRQPSSVMTTANGVCGDDVSIRSRQIFTKLSAPFFVLFSLREVKQPKVKKCSQTMNRIYFRVKTSPHQPAVCRVGATCEHVRAG